MGVGKMFMAISRVIANTKIFASKYIMCYNPHYEGRLNHGVPTLKQHLTQYTTEINISNDNANGKISGKILSLAILLIRSPHVITDHT